METGLALLLEDVGSVLELVVMIAQLCGYTQKNYLIKYCKEGRLYGM